LDNFKIIKWSKIDSFIGNKSSERLGLLRPCPICGSNKFRVISEMNNFQFYSDSATEPKRFDIRENMCLSCFTIYLNPCYSFDGFEILFSEAGQSYGSSLEHTREQIEWLKDEKLINNESSVLDVGCYEGDFLSKLPRFIKKIGVDIDKFAISRGQEKYKNENITLFSGDFETFSYGESTPSTITMFHLLEHLPRPVEVLKKLKSISDESTKLVVEVPVLENGKTNDINSFFSIQHTTHFSKSSLRNCFSMAGWKINKVHEASDYNGYRVLASFNSSIHHDFRPSPNNIDWKELNSNLQSQFDSIGNVESIIKKIPNSDYFVIWGGGAHLEMLYQLTSFFHINTDKKFIIVDSDYLKQGNTWRGISIYDPSIIKEIDWSSTYLLISSYGGQKSINESAIKLKVPAKKIIKLYNNIIAY
jgi:ubiquinone/menaquinone biosynthesis C-methylase UbiE